ncbi:MAG: ABC transporter substrate-binding protein [Coriobacteriia bacterium]|nr:ABC transporter substrate-binding protein [Coriobacteriia bacterium]MBS5477196.1 ABC transporter substrate-binding protein [Coriobacteriia bacterium]
MQPLLTTPLSRRSLVKGTLAATLGLGLASVLPAGLAPQVARADESDGTFTMAISFMPSSLQPSSGGNDDQTIVVRPVYECLFQELDGDKIEYHLADGVEISEDGLTYTIHIRDNANWSDGEPITVDDILFTIEYNGLKYDGKTSTTQVNGEDVTFTKKDDKTLEVVLPSVYVTYIYTMCNWTPLPAHAFDNDPSKVADNAGYFFTTDMVTSGAFTVEQINEDSIVYAPRADYYGGELSIKKLVAKTIGSGSTKQLAFENGEVSYMRVTTAEDLEKYAADEATYTLYSVSEARLNYLQLNPQGPVMSTLGEDARKALFLALNGQEIVDFAYGTDKLATPANSPLTPDQYDYDPECPGYTQDIEQAKQLAESSGLAGQTLTYIFNADRPNMEQVAVVVQQQLQAIGVNLSIEGLDSTTFFNRFFYGAYGTDQGNTWDLGSNGWDSERGISSRQAYNYLTSGTSRFMTGFSDELGELTKAANSNPDQAARKDQWKEIQQRYLDECWEYPLTYTNYVMVSRKDVSGLDASPIIPEFSQFAAIKLA